MAVVVVSVFVDRGGCVCAGVCVCVLCLVKGNDSSVERCMVYNTSSGLVC